MAGRLLFLSDAHLCPEAPERTRCLVDFLRGHGRAADAVYILGDLLDFWVGAKQRGHPAWAALLEQLADAVRDGPETSVLGGNRDYLLDAASLADYGLTSLGREHTFTADGTRFALVHGDRYYPDAIRSRLFLRAIQSRPACTLARRVPLWFSMGVAGAMRQWRRWVSRQWDAATATRYEAKRFAALFDAGAQVVVCGHNHWARDYTEELARPGCRLLALGEWAEEPSYLEYEGGVFRLVDPHLSG